MHQIPKEFSRWRRIPLNPNASNVQDLESPDGLERVTFGRLTGSLSWYRRPSKTDQFAHVGAHPLDPYIGNQVAGGPRRRPGPVNDPWSYKP